MRRTFSPEFKGRVVREVFREEKTISQIASEEDVHPNLVIRWRDVALTGLPGLFSGEDSQRQATREAEHERQLEELYAEIGKLTTQLTWLKKKSGQHDVPR